MTSKLFALLVVTAEAAAGFPLHPLYTASFVVFWLELLTGWPFVEKMQKKS